ALPRSSASSHSLRQRHHLGRRRSAHDAQCRQEDGAVGGKRGGQGREGRNQGGTQSDGIATLKHGGKPMVQLINSILSHTLVINGLFLVAAVITGFGIFRRKR